MSLYRVYSYSFPLLIQHSHHIVISASSKTFWGKKTKRKKEKRIHAPFNSLFFFQSIKNGNVQGKRNPSKKNYSECLRFGGRSQVPCSPTSSHYSVHAYISFTLWRKQHKTIYGRQASQHNGSLTYWVHEARADALRSPSWLGTPLPHPHDGMFRPHGFSRLRWCQRKGSLGSLWAKGPMDRFKQYLKAPVLPFF